MRIRFGIGYFNFQEQLSYLAYILLFIVNFLNDTCIGSSDFCELLIGSNVCQFLELAHFVPFFNVQLLYCSLFDFLAQIRKIKFQHSKSEFEAVSHMETKWQKRALQHSFDILLNLLLTHIILNNYS